MPTALRVARMIAELWGPSTDQQIEDCEQTACQAILEALPRHDPERGPLGIYAWKRVAGAVTNLLKRELAPPRTGFDDALDATGELRNTIDPLDDSDDDALAQLKGHCRYLTFRRCTGYSRAALPGRLDDVLMRVQVFEALSIALGRLTQEQKRFIALRYWENLTWAQIAERMSITERHAQRMDQHLRERLRRDLVRAGVDAAPPDVHA
jgi:RNA polymerase sigma factor for flagellar operon FliA